MESEIPLQHGLALRVPDSPGRGSGYPTDRLQRGFLLLDGSDVLAEEGVGFGVPVLKRGLQAIFAGAVTVRATQHESVWHVAARYQMNLVERIARHGSGLVDHRPLYAAKFILAGVIRRVPALRSFLTAVSVGLRRLFHWETVYLQVGTAIEASVKCTLDAAAGRLTIEMDSEGLPRDITEVILMNEQGALCFDRYGEADGVILQADEIGVWDRVRAKEAWFESSARRVRFSVGQSEGTLLFRGRELLGSRLAWAGFGHSFAPRRGPVRIEVTIERRA